MPYLGIFLDGRGFSSGEIGELFALITVARIAGPNLWAFLADKTGSALGVLQLGALLTFGTFCLVFFCKRLLGADPEPCSYDDVLDCYIAAD